MPRLRCTAAIALLTAAIPFAAGAADCTAAQNAVTVQTWQQTPPKALMDQQTQSSCPDYDNLAKSSGQAAACTSYTAKALQPQPSLGSCLSGILNTQVSKFSSFSISGMLSGLATQAANAACSAAQQSVTQAVQQVQNQIQTGIQNGVSSSIGNVVKSVTGTSSSGATPVIQPPPSTTNNSGNSNSGNIFNTIFSGGSNH